MVRGVTLLELAIVLAIAGFVLAGAMRPLGRALDHFAVDGAARDATTLLATARHTAVAQRRRARVRLEGDSLAIDTLGPSGWGRHHAWPGPATRGVGMRASNSEVTFSPTGVAWGVSNTTIVFTRGSHVETVIVSRLGRIRRG
jgi:prepilin-type N-terminal cleavage/methylation domain-containing protein